MDVNLFHVFGTGVLCISQQIGLALEDTDIPCKVLHRLDAHTDKPNATP